MRSTVAYVANLRGRASRRGVRGGRNDPRHHPAAPANNVLAISHRGNHLPFPVREIYVHQDHARVGHYKSILDDAGIPNYIRNGVANNITDMPSPVFFPVLCVIRDEDYAHALEVLGEIHNVPESRDPDWRCPNCQENVPGNFGICWQCGTPHPEGSLPAEGSS